MAIAPKQARPAAAVKPAAAPAARAASPSPQPVPARQPIPQAAKPSPIPQQAAMPAQPIPAKPIAALPVAQKPAFIPPQQSPAQPMPAPMPVIQQLSSQPAAPSMPLTAAAQPKKPGFMDWFLGKSDKLPKQPLSDYKPLFRISFMTDIPALPEMDDPRKMDVRYMVIDPYVHIHIKWDPASSEVKYIVEEPELSAEEKKHLRTVEEGLTELINMSYINIEDENAVIEFLEKNLRILLDEFGISVNQETFLKFMYFIYRDFVGMNLAEPLLKDYFIEDIECNGFATPIYIVHRKYRNLETSVIFPDMRSLTSFVEKLAQKCSKYVSYANPLLDGVLPDGSRVNATYTEDITSRGPTFTIRKFTKEPWTPIKLMDFKTVSPEILAYLWIAIENKSNVLIIGGTGSGKTSFLNAIAFFIPPAARIVSIEDTRELNLKHENWLPAVSRAGMGVTSITGEKHGEVSLFDLLKESLRQRPDYIIVGEIRGKEAYVMFQGMTTGHPSFGTMHAESVDTVVKRLILPPISLPPDMVEALDVICIITPAKISGKEVRRIKEIDEITKVNERGEVAYNAPFVRDPAKDVFLFKTSSKVFEKIMSRTGMTWDMLLREFRVRAKLLMEMYRRKIFNFAEVQDIIHQYYKTPQDVMKKFGITG